MDSWTSADMPTPRGAFTKVLEGIICVVGGEGSTGMLAVNEAYDPRKDAWEKSPMPSKRGVIAGASLKNKIYVFGGKVFTFTFDFVEVYDARQMLGKPLNLCSQGGMVLVL